MSNMLVNSPIPGVDLYAQAANSAKLAYQKAQAQIGNNRQTLLHNYGYNASFDPTSGQMSGLTVDPNNQYGQLQTTLHNEAQDAYNTYANSVGRGLLGGLAHQNENQVHYSYGGQKQQLGLNLMGSLQGEQTNWDNATTTYNNALLQAEQAALMQALMNGQFDTPNYGDYTPDYGDTTPSVPTYSKGTPPPKPSQSGSMIAVKPGQSLASAEAQALAKVMPKTPAKVVANAYNTNKNKRG